MLECAEEKVNEEVEGERDGWFLWCWREGEKKKKKSNLAGVREEKNGSLWVRSFAWLASSFDISGTRAQWFPMEFLYVSRHPWRLVNFSSLNICLVYYVTQTKGKKKNTYTYINIYLYVRTFSRDILRLLIHLLWSLKFIFGRCEGIKIVNYFFFFF